MKDNLVFDYGVPIPSCNSTTEILNRAGQYSKNTTQCLRRKNNILISDTCLIYFIVLTSHCTHWILVITTTRGNVWHWGITFNVTVFSFHSSHGTLHLKGNMACDANWTGWICRDWLNTQNWVTIGSLGIIPEYRRCLKHWQNIGTACKAKYRQKMITWAKLMFWSVILLHRRTVCIRSISSGASILTKFRSWWWLEWWHDYVSLQWLSVSRHVRR